MRALVVTALGALAFAAALGACKDDPIAVAPATSAGDGSHAALVEAAGALRAANHTAAAYRTFAARVLALRADMDETVAEEAELLVATEALPVVRAAPARGETAEVLALAVWPIALAPPIAAPIPGTPQADRWTAYVPRGGEDHRAYLERICGAELALACKDVVPEGHLAVVGALAVQRLADRARRAIATCLTCGEPRWAQTIAGWEEVARAATATVDAARRANAPSRWPEAGAAAAPVPPASSAVRHVHLPPDTRIERVRYALDDARAAGAASIALLARERAYPYALRAYVIPTSTKQLPARAGEPVQMLTRALDARARGASAARRR